MNKFKLTRAYVRNLQEQNKELLKALKEFVKINRAIETQNEPKLYDNMYGIMTDALEKAKQLIEKYEVSK